MKRLYLVTLALLIAHNCSAANLADVVQQVVQAVKEVQEGKEIPEISAEGFNELLERLTPKYDTESTPFFLALEHADSSSECAETVKKYLDAGFRPKCSDLYTTGLTYSLTGRRVLRNVFFDERIYENCAGNDKECIFSAALQEGNSIAVKKMLDNGFRPSYNHFMKLILYEQPFANYMRELNPEDSLQRSLELLSDRRLYENCRGNDSNTGYCINFNTDWDLNDELGWRCGCTATLIATKALVADGMHVSERALAKANEMIDYYAKRSDTPKHVINNCHDFKVFIEVTLETQAIKEINT